MTQSEIEEYFYDQCKDFGVEVWLTDSFPWDSIDDERIAIIVGHNQPSRYWNNCYVKINWLVPDINTEANKIRLKEIESSMKVLHRGGGDGFRYSLDRTSVENDSQLRCHYVNITLLFQSQNILSNE